MTRVWCGRASLIAGIAALLASAGHARADEFSQGIRLQKQVAAVMSVLRAAHADLDDACSSALDQMDQTEGQMQQLSHSMQYDNESTPVLEHQSGEMGLGRDVLSSDMTQMLASCRPAAEQLCAAPDAGALAAPCATLRRTAPAPAPAPAG